MDIYPVCVGVFRSELLFLVQRPKVPAAEEQSATHDVQRKPQEKCPVRSRKET